MPSFSHRRRSRPRRLRSERLETRYALATFTVNTPGTALDADPDDGVWDVDLDTPGVQLTLAAAAQAANAEGVLSTINIAIDGELGGAEFNVPVEIFGQQHNVDLSGGNLKLNQGGKVVNLKITEGTLWVIGNNATIQNNTITTTNFYALIVQGNTALIEENVTSGSGVALFGNSNHFETNSVSGGQVDVQGNDNHLISNTVILSPASGILLAGNNNEIRNNQIGTNGTADLGNAADGIRLTAATGASTANVIVGNTISGNGGYGISIRDTQSTENRVEGNLIGTSGTGLTAIPNTLGGILIENSGNNTIGGTTTNTGNLISGNTGSGIRIEGATSTNNAILSNFIGLTKDTTAKLPNGASGVIISGGQSNRIGDVNGSNFISGNTEHGVLLTGSAKLNVVRGNIIGTNANNGTQLGNGGDGVRIDNATENQIDGTGAINRISGNLGAGIRLQGTGTTKNSVTINAIGLTSNSLALPNQQGGITIADGASQNVIGGNSNKLNIISGNALWGVAINDSDNNLVAGNFIGTNTAGTAGVGTQPIGVLIENGSKNNQIGFVAGLGQLNIIAGNTSHGVQIRGTGTNNNTLAGNYIGRSAVNQANIGNGGYGVLISDHAAQNAVGVAVSQVGQYIFKSALGGVAIIEGAAQNTVINTLIDGAGGGGSGVLLDNAQSNTIGDTALTFGNVIRANAQHGIRVQGGSLNNRLQGNGISGSGGQGISLEPALADLPRQANIRQILRNGTEVTVNYEVLGTPGSTVRIDFYANKAADASGFGEGELPLGWQSVVVPASGLGLFQVKINVADASYTHFAITQTDAANTTYGFSRATSTAHVPSSTATVAASSPTNDVQPITLTATITSTGTPTGAVEFYDGTTLLGTAQLNASKKAVLTVQLAQGQRSIIAYYKGTSTFAGIIAAPITLNVVPGPPNVPPVANTDTATVIEDGSIIINVLSNDTDPDGGTILPTTVVITQQPAHGTATINPTTGAITYTPSTNYDGPDTLRYTVKDNRNGTSNAALVTITVTDIPEPWHHKAKPLDVDRDGLVTPTDAAYVINMLNALGPGLLTAPTQTDFPFVDVDGDNILTPTDVALLINALNAGVSGEPPDAENITPLVSEQSASGESALAVASAQPFASLPSEEGASSSQQLAALSNAPVPVTAWSSAAWSYWLALTTAADHEETFTAAGAGDDDYAALEDLFAHWA